MNIWKHAKAYALVAISLAMGFVISTSVIHARQEQLSNEELQTLYFVQVRDFAELAQQKEFSAKGKYRRVKAGGVIDKYTFPPNIEMHEYQSPDGFGFQLIMDTASSTISYGFGPEAQARTYEQPKIDLTDYWAEIEL
jgi:hypothetical protein